MHEILTSSIAADECCENGLQQESDEGVYTEDESSALVTIDID